MTALNYENLTTETTGRLSDDLDSLKLSLNLPKSHPWGIKGWSARNVAVLRVQKINLELRKNYRHRPIGPVPTTGQSRHTWQQSAHIEPLAAEAV